MVRVVHDLHSEENKTIRTETGYFYIIVINACNSCEGVGVEQGDL